MALSVTRNALLSRALLRASLSRYGAVFQFQVASITHVTNPHMTATFGEKFPYKKPFPYEKYRFNLLHQAYDDSLARLNENSKVIVVEGNIGAGKEEFAKSLARNFDLKFFPSISEEDAFCATNTNNVDIRMMDELLPESAQSYTNLKLFSDPNPQYGAASKLQYIYYNARYYQYSRALLHLFSTGQGVVLVRSAFSNRVFTEAFRKMEWIRKRFMPWYDDYEANSLCELNPPHLTVYLDAPVDKCMSNIRARGHAEEKGKNFTEELLVNIENNYRDSFLPRQKRTHEVLELDWSSPASDLDIEVITEEICNIPLHCEDNDSTKYAMWRHFEQDDLAHFRNYFGNKNKIDSLLLWRHIPLDQPEFSYSQADNEIRQERVMEHPAVKGQPGYIKELENKTSFLQPFF